MHNKVKHINNDGHQKVNHINITPVNYTYHNSQHNQVNRPPLKKTTEESQEHICHEKILSIQINDMQKLTYNAKVSNTKATALLDSGTMLSCISK